MSLIDIRDKVNIYASQTLSIDDYASISTLYQPLIGCEALALYEVMYSLLDRQVLSQDELIYCNLLDLLKLSNEKFDEARLRLEAIGLLETFKKNDVFVFLLKAPLTPSKFLNDTVFGAYLKSEVGEQMFNMLVSKFKIAKFDRLGYDNVTASFDDIFESTENEMPNINGFILGRKPNTSVNIENHNFDFSLFESNLDESLLEYGITPQIRRTIINLSYVYGFNEDEMVSICNSSIGRNGYLDLAMLKRKADRYYKHEAAAPLKIEVKSKISEDELRAMNLVANTSIVEMLDNYWPDYPQTYLKTIGEIYDQINLDRGIINILVFHVLKLKNGELPTVNYFKKTAENWANSGIITREDAWLYVRGLRPTDEPKMSAKVVKGANVKSNEYSDVVKNNIKGVMKDL